MSTELSLIEVKKHISILKGYCNEYKNDVLAMDGWENSLLEFLWREKKLLANN